MKKIVWLFLGGMYASTIFAGTNLEFENKKLLNKDNQNHLTIEVNYPQIKSPSQRNENLFNAKAQQSASAIVEDFKKNLAKNETDRLPAEVRAQGSYLKITYDLTSIEPKKWISLRFLADSNQAGAAHPSHTYSALNYDLVQNKGVTLKDLLKPKALDQIAKMATQKEKEQLHTLGNDPVTVFDEGLTPTQQNYATWNVTSKGLQITFNEYQVVAYTYGPQEVVIPFKDIQNYLANKTELANCLTANNCNFGTFSSPK